MTYDALNKNLPKQYEWERFLERKDLELINSWCMDVSYKFNIPYTKLVHKLCECFDDALREQGYTFFDIIQSSENNRYKFLLLVWNKVFRFFHICNPCNIEDYMNIIMIYSKWYDRYRTKELIANDCLCKKCLR